ncbi:hypothetical protein ACH429_15815 [Streptomyces pathocidini]|uniref:Integral membrane protein n=1 Tax=Streptomyces pathocidini TaxID=1650571 RepID=A0ABW7USG5_9ACTN|nr:hypothetical protein [Streptomyces pathocidini]
MSTSAHPALPGRARHRRPKEHRVGALRGMSVGIPLTLGIAYGLYAAWLSSNNGESNTFITIVALVGGAAVAALCFLLGKAQRRLKREQRAAAYAVLFGGAMGYLQSLSGETWLKAGFLGLFMGLGMAIVVFYLRYTHES